jgi:hypothetical protein
MGFTPSEKPDDHGDLVRFFRQRTKFQQLVIRLEELRLRRNDADYRDEVDFDWEVAATDSHDKASKILALIK